MSDQCIIEADDELPDDAFDAEAQFLASLKAIRLEKKSIYDRLRSIVEDARFVQTVTDRYKLPLVCNERCGRWYCADASKIATSVYFKSTDGHTHQWRFSLRRLNLHILKLVCEHGGVTIVDSTRRGKRIPDALSKTIPIWAAVLNRCCFLLTGSPRFDVELQTPDCVVSDSENDMIAQKIDGWAHELLETGIDRTFIEQLKKPLRPVWVSQGDCMPDMSPICYNLVLVTASKCVPDGIERVQGYIYHQGGADDEELWSQALSPAIFWEHEQEILRDRDSIEEAICRAVALPSCVQPISTLVQVGETSIWIGSGAVPEMQTDTVLITTFESTKSLVGASFDASKAGLAKLSNAFTQVEDALDQQERWKGTVTIIDDEDCKSKAPILALLVLCKFYGFDGRPLNPPRSVFNKEIVRKHLVTLVNCRSGINPPRKFLQALNTHLMSNDFHR
jgi:tRNA A64-2'-O-ribosylphosphate transferase